jgi:hypothetical protein
LKDNNFKLSYMQQYSDNDSSTCYLDVASAQRGNRLERNRTGSIHILSRTQCHHPREVQKHVWQTGALELLALAHQLSHLPILYLQVKVEFLVDHQGNNTLLESISCIAKTPLINITI